MPGRGRRQPPRRLRRQPRRLHGGFATPARGIDAALPRLQDVRGDARQQRVPGAEQFPRPQRHAGDHRALQGRAAGAGCRQ